MEVEANERARVVFYSEEQKEEQVKQGGSSLVYRALCVELYVGFWTESENRPVWALPLTSSGRVSLEFCAFESPFGVNFCKEGRPFRGEFDV